MKENEINTAIITVLRERMPHKATLTRRLVDLLSMEREAVYRRMRGEVPFSLHEVNLLSKEFGFSLDALLNGEPLGSNHFKLYIDERDQPMDTDLAKLQTVIDILSDIKNEPYSELYSSSNSLPQGIFLKYEAISKFFIFKWLYQYEGSVKVRSFKDVEIAPRIMELQKKYYREAMHIKHTSYIWDNLIFQYFVNDIKYFQSIKMICDQGVKLIRDELMTLLKEIETFAAKGCYETGNKVSFYISNVNFDSSYSYIETPKLRCSSIKAFTLNRVTTVDADTFLRLKKWIQSLKRVSTLISESGEIQRVQFFDKQRKIISEL